MNISGIDSLTLDDYEFLLSVLTVDITKDEENEATFENFDMEDLDPATLKMLESSGYI